MSALDALGWLIRSPVYGTLASTTLFPKDIIDPGRSGLNGSGGGLSWLIHRGDPPKAKHPM